MVLGFKVPGGGRAEVALTRQPIGLSFEPGIAPIVITAVEAESQGAELGVQPGWILASVAGADVSSESFERTRELIVQGVGKLPDRPALLQAAVQAGDVKAALKLLGVPLWAFVVAEVLITVLEVVLVVFVVRLLPSEWLAALPESVRGLLQPGSGSS